ncbi:MAG: TraB/GumN family protein [Candidatus Aminicenantes bacterium]|nr:MAG: TraB/GumN family protein [Candidatus Aminicenantes bacterium]
MMRRKLFVLVLISLVSLVMLYSQESTGKSFLWEIQTDKGNSYLFGSVHLLKKEHYPLKKVIEDSFEQSDVLVLEIDLSGGNLLKAGTFMLKKGKYLGEETLKDNISEKTYQLVKDKAKTMGMDMDWLNGWKPWMAALNILQSKLMQMGFNPMQGIDLYFLKKAEGKKKVMGLETIELQVGLFENFSKQESEKFLLSTILEADQLEKEMGKMISAWASGDVESLTAAMTENIEKYPELMDFYKKLNDDRNVRMVEKIISFLRTGKSYFIVVGALHMVGKKGIVQLLRDKGYNVNQL